jgi:hypothetical protein
MGGELEIEAAIATPPNLSAFSLAIIPSIARTFSSFPVQALPKELTFY